MSTTLSRPGSSKKPAAARGVAPDTERRDERAAVAIWQCGAPGGTILPMREDPQHPAPTQRSAWLDAEAHGCDMSLLQANLGKTPAERIRAHDRALATAEALRRAMEQRTARA